MGYSSVPDCYGRKEVRVTRALYLFSSINASSSYRYTDPARHPASKSMEKARLDTFSKSRWPHDAVKGHGANSKAVSRRLFASPFWCVSSSGGLA